MARSAKKCDKNMALQKEKLKKAIEQGNMEGARIYGQNVIREKNQSLNFLRLGSRIDAVASRLVLNWRSLIVFPHVSGLMSDSNGHVYVLHCLFVRRRPSACSRSPTRCSPSRSSSKTWTSVQVCCCCCCCLACLFSSPCFSLVCVCVLRCDSQDTWRARWSPPRGYPLRPRRWTL